MNVGKELVTSLIWPITWYIRVLGYQLGEGIVNEGIVMECVSILLCIRVLGYQVGGSL